MSLLFQKMNKQRKVLMFSLIPFMFSVLSLIGFYYGSFVSLFAPIFTMYFLYDFKKNHDKWNFRLQLYLFITFFILVSFLVVSDLLNPSIILSGFVFQVLLASIVYSWIYPVILFFSLLIESRFKK